ncbi:MAG: FtsX-like permease family protein [Bacillota bacterium]|nr:FtsX-like permease family protein [Bacillota bacterium]
MKKTFFKNLFRDIKGTLSRFLSIVIIIAVGVSFYAGVRAGSPDMKKSADYYFNKDNFMDFKLISTLGLTNSDLSEVEKQKGITKAEGSHSVDAVIEKGKTSLVLNINSLPDESGINKIRIVSGREPNNDNEAIVEDRFLKNNKLKIGDKISLKSGNDSKLEDTLKNTEFEIVGTAQSPLYISSQRQLSSVGNGSVRGFVYILPEVFKSDVYTEIYVSCSSNESQNSLIVNDKYKSIMDSIEKNLKNLGSERSGIRYEDILKEADDKINDAESKLSSSKKEAFDKFNDADKQLQDAQNKINDGREELKKNQNDFNEKMAESEKQISDGKLQIQSAQNELDSKSKEIEDGKLQIAKAKSQLDDSENQLNAGKKQAADNISSAISSKLADAKKQMDSDSSNAAYALQYNMLNQLYEKDINGKDFDTMYESLKNDNLIDQIKAYFDIEALKSTFDKSDSDISSGRQQIAVQEKSLQDGESKIQAGIAELETNKKKIADSETQLSTGKQEGQSKLDDGLAKLNDSQKEVDDNTANLKSEKDKANSKFTDAEAEIQKNKDKLKDIKKPDWYVLGRSQNVGYESYRQDSNRIDNIGKAFPFIFFLVAALVSLTTMTRMVQEKRTEIGTLKALGYSRGAIVAHYLIYSLTASLVGSILGISIGFKLFPPIIMNAYGSLYTVPDSVTPFNTQLALEAALIAVVFTTAASVAAALEELREVPASLMRPKPPKSGKTILLEKMTFIWKRLGFTTKVTARNIFRYKQRFFMTVIGIAACTGLMITGFGLKGGMIGATENQFNKIYKYDMMTSLTKNIDEKEKSDIKDKVISNDNIKSVLFYYLKNSSVKEGSSASEDAYLVVPENKDELNKYINLTFNNKSLELNDDGVIITEKLSKLTHKKAGDIIEITINDKVIKAKISKITEQYIQHYVYMSPNYYEKLVGEKPEFNGFYGLINSKSESSENDTAEKLTEIKSMSSVSFKNNTHVDFQKSMKSINSVVLVLIVSAGVLAFVVIYNLTNININERKRELATIKLLGFYDNELASYIYRENIILTIIGSVTGIALGKIMNRFVENAAETNLMMFFRKINPEYFLYSVAFTIIFSIIVNLAMYSRFDKIDMIESLKNAE